MVDVSIMIEGQDGLTWPRWKRLAETVDALGFAGLFRSDHFTNAEPPDKDALEMVISLAYLAARTTRIHFGPLVAPLTIRDPVMLARQALALDDLSGGRMILGLGAGWQEREHDLFGYALGDTAARLDRLEEGLEVATRLLHGDTPATFEGRFFRLHGATLLPQPQRPGGPPILVGGNGRKRTLPLAARFADVWNGVFLTPRQFRETSGMLDGLVRESGRQTGAVRRTLMTGLIFAPDMDALGRKLQAQRDTPALAGKSMDEVIATMHAERPLVVGTPDEVAARIVAYGQAGVEEIMLQWFDMDDVDGLGVFAERVLPYV